MKQQEYWRREEEAKENMFGYCTYFGSNLPYTKCYSIIMHL